MSNDCVEREEFKETISGFGKRIGKLEVENAVIKNEIKNGFDSMKTGMRSVSSSLENFNKSKDTLWSQIKDNAVNLEKVKSVHVNIKQAAKWISIAITAIGTLVFVLLRVT